jgi:cell wall-associated NlpC family hydrolase
LVALALAGASLATSGAPGSAAPSQAELSAAKERLLELERDFQLVSERYNLINERFTALQIEIAQSEEAIDALERRMAGKEDAAIALARRLYMRGGSVDVEAVLSAESFAEIERRLQYMRSSEAHNTRVFERLSVDRSLLESEVDELQAAQAKAAEARSRLAALADEIDAKVAEQEDEIARLNAAIEAAERRAAERRAAAAAAAAAAAPQITVDPAAVGAAPAPNPRAQAAVDAALSQVGKPYQWGAAGPDSYDCSGLTMWAWSQAGVALPHNSGAQYAATPRVAQNDWAPGDLLFFGSPIHHVGMYIGNGRMVEAPYSGQVVRVNSASRSDYVGAGRPGV